MNNLLNDLLFISVHSFWIEWKISMGALIITKTYILTLVWLYINAREGNNILLYTITSSLLRGFFRYFYTFCKTGTFFQHIFVSTRTLFFFFFTFLKLHCFFWNESLLFFLCAGTLFLYAGTSFHLLCSLVYFIPELFEYLSLFWNSSFYTVTLISLYNTGTLFTVLGLMTRFIVLQPSLLYCISFQYKGAVLQY